MSDCDSGLPVFVSFTMLRAPVVIGIHDELASRLGRPIEAFPARTETTRISARGGDKRTAVDGERCVAPAVRGPLQVAKEASGAHRFDNFEDSIRPLKPAVPYVDT
jgi:hypothetical protein